MTLRRIILAVTWVSVTLAPAEVGPYLSTLSSYTALQSKVSCYYDVSHGVARCEVSHMAEAK